MSMEKVSYGLTYMYVQLHENKLSLSSSSMRHPLVHVHMYMCTPPVYTCTYMYTGTSLAYTISLLTVSLEHHHQYCHCHQHYYHDHCYHCTYTWYDHDRQSLLTDYEGTHTGHGRLVLSRCKHKPFPCYMYLMSQVISYSTRTYVLIITGTLSSELLPPGVTVRV